MDRSSDVPSSPGASPPTGRSVSSFRPRVVPWLLALLGLSAGCGGTTSPEASDLEVKIVSGDEQSAVVTRTLPEPLVVRVFRSGRPMADVPVSWSVREEECGTAAAARTRTDGEGFARNSWTLGEAAYTTLQENCTLWAAPAAAPRSGRGLEARSLAGPLARNGYVSGRELRGKVYPETYPFPGRLLADEYGNPQPFVARVVSGPLFVLGFEPGERTARTVKAAVPGEVGPGPRGSHVDSAIVELRLEGDVMAVIDIEIQRAELPEHLQLVGTVR